MAVEYKLIPKRNPQDPEAEPKYYATPVYHKTITMEELAREVSARSTTTSEGDVYSVLVDVRDIIRAHIAATRSNALQSADEENVEEDGSNVFSRDSDLTRAADQHKRLRAIDDALLAIKNKTYGICSMCGCLIPRDRLRAWPFAIRCVKCKQKYEESLAAAKRTQG